MTLNEYQNNAMQTCMATSNNFAYMFLNLAGEVGEFSSKIAKLIRKGNGVVNANHLCEVVPDFGDARTKEELSKELGDILWQLSGLCSVLDLNLEDVAKQNLQKLADRQKRNVIDGNGDNR